ncbi:MAG TPA: M67 family metallopeptidase [Candidatus Acidoferrum sp.]|nr:M67 family metallopeptidase [Candidatus Acidoferrum sp.]
MSGGFHLNMSHDLAERIGQHGAEAFPHECCGALLGRDSAFEEGASGADSRREVLELFPLINRRDDSPRNRFAVTAEDVMEAEKAARQHGLDVVGWYHSHPDHPARPSQFDREHAWPWYSYIIVSVMSGKPAEMTSWRLNDDRQDYTPERIEIRNRAAV